MKSQLEISPKLRRLADIRRNFGVALALGLFFPNTAIAENFSYDDKSQIEVLEISYSATSVNARDFNEQVTVSVTASNTFNYFYLAVAQFHSEKAGHLGFGAARPFGVANVNGRNQQKFTVNIEIPKGTPEGVLQLILRFDSPKPDGSFWHSDLYGPPVIGGGSRTLPSQLQTTIVNSYSAVSVGATKVAAEKAARDKVAAEKAAAEKLAADKAAADRAAALNKEMNETFIALTNNLNKYKNDISQLFRDYPAYFKQNPELQTSLQRAIDYKIPAVASQSEIESMRELIGGGSGSALASDFLLAQAGITKYVALENIKAKTAKKSTITCVKGKLSKKVSAVNPKCPAGYKVKK